MSGQPILLLLIRYFLAFYAGFLIVIGSLGNIFIIFGMRSNLRIRIPRLILVILAGSDTAVLWVAVLRYWIEITFDIDIRTSSNLLCVFHTFLTYITTDFAVAVLCTLSVERLVSMRYPLRSKVIDSWQKVCFCAGVSVFVIAMKHAPLLWITHLGNGTVGCSYNKDWCNLAMCPHTWIEFITHSLLPYVLLIPTNISLYIIIRKHSEEAFRNSGSFNSVRVSRFSRISERSIRNRGMVSSKILICLSILHFCLSFPGLLYIEFLGVFEIRYFPSDSEESKLLYNALFLLTSTNNALNFFTVLYFSNEFRNTISQMLKLKWFCHGESGEPLW